MSEPFVTVSRGGPSADNDLPDGVYPLELIAISDPRPVDATRGPNAGKTINLIDWTWSIDWPGNPLDERTLDSSTSTASGPKSKMFSYLTALFNGTPPPVGTALRKEDLVGRHVLGTINHDEDGWIRLANVSALPPQMLAQSFAAATGTPTAVPPVVPVAQPVAVANDLPF